MTDKPAGKNNQDNFKHVLAGGGEMGDRIRDFDWSQTPLGSISDWEQSLKTAVNLILNSRFSMFVWWGEELIYLYNDAYAPTLGIRHPAALGKSAREVWAEIWDVIGPQARDVIEKGESSWNENLLLFLERSGFPEETYHTFSYSPAIRNDGKIGGLFCAVTETTQQVIGERRLKTLRDLSERTSEEAKSVEDATRAAREILSENLNDVPFSLIYLLDADSKNWILRETIGIDRRENSAAAPEIVKSDTESDVWNFGGVMRAGHGQKFSAVEEKFGRISAGAWTDDWTREAFILPLSKPGLQNEAAGFLVCGISPRLNFDEDYRGFLELAAGHIATAISNARALEEERARAAKLAALDRAKTEFFSNVSHEFRTPITLMLGNLEEVLTKGAPLSPSERENIETAHRNSLRLLKLVNNLLDFSRIEAGRAHANFEPTDLAKFTAELASNFRAGMEKAGLKLEIDCPPLSAPVYADHEMWEKIVLNLISNAFKFTFEGAIEISLTEKDERVELKVKDTGVGIPQSQIKEIFKRFHRVHNAHGRTHEGTGIGLSLVEELVKLHGGEIAVESELGVGTTFTVALPKGKAHLPAEQITDRSGGAVTSAARAAVFLNEISDGGLTSANAAAEAAPLAAAGDSTILLADDNDDMREYVRRLLAQSGYHVTAVADGQAAWDFLQQSESAPDLVLTDVMMPRVDGFELLGKIRKNPNTVEIPVVMLSARAGEESKVEGLHAGADDYLVKPFSARELLARVKTNLEMGRIRREAARREAEILESVGDCFIALDQDWRFVYFNRCAEEYFGMPRNQALGETLWKIFPDAENSIFAEKYCAARETNEIIRFETASLIKEDGWVSVDVYPSENGLSIYFRDITDKKNAEEKLRNSENQLRVVTDSLPVLISYVDAASRYRFVNRTYTDWFEIAPEQIIGKHVREILGEEAYCQALPDLERALRGERITYERVMAYKTAGTRQVEVNLIPDSENGRVKGYFALIQDISERKRRELNAAFLAEIGEDFAQLSEPAAIMQTVGEKIGKFLNLSSCAFNEIDLKNAKTTVPFGWFRDDVPNLTGGVYDHSDYVTDEFHAAAKRGETIVVGDTQADSRIADKNSYLNIKIGSFVSIPFHRDGTWKFLLAVTDSAARNWRADEIELIRELSSRIFPRLERALAEEKLRHVAELDAYRVALADALRGSSSPLEVQKIAGRVLGEYLGANRVAYFEIQGEDYVVEHDYTNGVEPISGRFPIASFGDKLFTTYRNGETVYDFDTENNPALSADERHGFDSILTRAFIGVPLVKNGNLVAGLTVHSVTPRVWTKEEFTIVSETAERTWAAVEHARAEKALRESQSHLQITTEAANIGTWQWNPQTTRIVWNEIQQQMWGYEPTDSPAFYQDGARLVLPEDVPLVEAAIEKCLRGAEDYDIEYRIKPLDTDEVRWIRSKGRAFFDEAGEAVSIQGISLDITERKKAEQEREQLFENEQTARREAENANRLKDEFLATVSHELRTPLNAIMGWSTIARQSSFDDQIMRRALEVIERSARNQNQIISDILDVSRIVTGKLNLNMKPLTLAPVINAAVDTLRPALDAKQINLEMNLADDSQVMTGDADRLQQIVWNLLSNAVKFTPAGGAIEIISEYRDGAAAITVRDNGSGIEPEFLPFVFDRFRQADGKTNRKYGGLGLGLAIVRHLTELHGGSASVESEGKGSGATFTIRLPLKTFQKDSAGKKSNGGAAVKETDLPPQPALQKPFSGLKILVVDDEADALELASFILQENGAEVFNADSVAAALEIFSEKQPDFIVSDVGMPDRDGYDLIREIKARAGGGGKPVQTVALTAYARSEDERKLLKAGYDAYLPKPLEPARLIELIDELKSKMPQTAAP